MTRPSLARLARCIARVLALGAALSTLPALAGSVMVTEAKVGNETYTNEARVQGANLRVDDNEGRRSSFIMAGKVIYIVDHQDRTYHVLDEPTMRRIGGQVAAARRQMEAQMANMPPEQRRMMQEMMGRMGQAPGAAPAVPRTQYRRTARSESAAGIACTVWEGLEGGRKTDEVCVAPVARVPGGTEMLAAMRQMGENMKKLNDALGMNFGDAVDEAWAQVNTLGGIPIIQREYEGGRLTSSAVLKSMRAMNVPAASFAPPAGYRRTTLEMGGQ